MLRQDLWALGSVSISLPSFPVSSVTSYNCLSSRSIGEDWKRIHYIKIIYPKLRLSDKKDVIATVQSQNGRDSGFEESETCTI